MTDKATKLSYLLSYTPKVMPNNPTAQGWTADQIRYYQYHGFEILFDYYVDMYDGFTSDISTINTNITNIQNDISTEISNREQADTNIKESISTNRKEVDDEIVETNSNLQDLTNTYNEFVSTYNSQLEVILGDLETHSTDISKLDTRVTNLETKSTEFTNKFSSVDNTLTEVKNTLNEKVSINSILDTNGIILSSVLPSYVDDVLEYNSKSDFPLSGETGKIYVDKTKNLTYRWSGSVYVEISPSLALGETADTAYSGLKGLTNANNITKLDTRVTSLESRTTLVENSVTTNTSDISTLKTNVGTNTSDISTLKTNTSGLSEKITTNTSDIGTLSSKVNDLASKIDNISFDTLKSVDSDGTKYLVHLEASSDGLSLVFEN